MDYTLFSRLKDSLSSFSSIRHLKGTWRFALNEMMRSISGKQLNEVLFELEHISLNRQPSLKKPALPIISGDRFKEIAINHVAGKNSGHHHIYSMIESISPFSCVLEIGIGSNNTTVPSNMGKKYKPGSSLRMWSEIFPNAQIIGADIDRDSHYYEKNISSFFLDTTSSESIYEFIVALKDFNEKNLIHGFDLVIDDGLHTPESNLRTFAALFPLVNEAGYYVIEDIHVSWKGFWIIFADSIPNCEWTFVDSSKNSEGKLGFLMIRKILTSEAN